MDDGVRRFALFLRLFWENPRLNLVSQKEKDLYIFFITIFSWRGARVILIDFCRIALKIKRFRAVNVLFCKHVSYPRPGRVLHYLSSFGDCSKMATPGDLSFWPLCPSWSRCGWGLPGHGLLCPRTSWAISSPRRPSGGQCGKWLVGLARCEPWYEKYGNRGVS